PRTAGYGVGRLRPLEQTDRWSTGHQRNHGKSTSWAGDAEDESQLSRHTGKNGSPDSYCTSVRADISDVDGALLTTCSFWSFEALVLTGAIERARVLFEKMLGYLNHLGLYAEELGLSG